MRLKKSISVNSQNKINIMDFLPKPENNKGAMSLSKRMKKALDDKIMQEKKKNMLLD